MTSNKSGSTFFIHADGGARGNPGPAGAGAVIRDELGNIIGSVSDYLGRQTNNFAEYEAVLRAFDRLRTLVPPKGRAATAVIVKMDSELVVKQMKGIYKVRHPVLKEKQAELARRCSAFGPVTFLHVPRAENSDADALANAAMDRGI